MTLEFVEHILETSPDSLVIFLHGYGADKNDLIGLAPHISHALPNTAFISPDGLSPCDAGFGRQWFSLQSMDIDSIYGGLEIAYPHIDDFIDSQIERFGLTADRVALLGFSQGSMLSMHTAPRRRATLAGVVGFSGMLAGSDILKNEIKTKPPFVLIHGDADEVVNVEFLNLASNTLIENGCVVDTLICPNLGHSIDNEGLLMASSFLQKCFKV